VSGDAHGLALRLGLLLSLPCGTFACSQGATIPGDDPGQVEDWNQTPHDEGTSQELDSESGDGSGETESDEETQGDTSEVESTESSESITSDDSQSDDLPGGCDDGVQNGLESDVDCGGPVCSACANGDSCGGNDDCASNSCEAGSCVEATCSDLIKNQGESDIDCGGPCGPCDVGEGCVEDADCVERICLNAQCQQASCADGVKNGKESDVDCGGADCKTCAVGDDCSLSSDCQTGLCENGSCVQAQCTTDSDCAALDGECTAGHCDQESRTCKGLAVREGLSCDSNTACIRDERCKMGGCSGGVALDCSGFDSACSAGYCDPKTDACDSHSLVSFFDPFSADIEAARPWWVDGSWSEWNTGPARASFGCYGGDDPSVDHTQGSADNWVLGTVIGGCTQNGSTDLDCVYTPLIDTSGAGANDVFSFYRHLHQLARPDAASAIYFRDVYDNWVAIESGYTSDSDDAEWTLVSLPINGFRHNRFKAAICTWMPNGIDLGMGGWTIDDVLIGPPSCDAQTAFDESSR
jgi:hypothetical protein